MTELKWCCRKREIELIQPNNNLAMGFLEKAKRSLEEINHAVYLESKINHAYYAMYNALYALLQKAGIKSEIHACTFEIARFFLSEYFHEEEIDYIEKGLQLRIDATYYTDKKIPDKEALEMISKAPEIVAKCKSILPKITEKNIKNIRNEISRLKG